MKSKKALTRIIAMVLCVLSVTALLPTVAFAAEPETDKVAAVTNQIAENVKSNGFQTVYVGRWYRCSVPTCWYLGGRRIAVKYQWQVKKGNYRLWTNLKGCTTSAIRFKAATCMNGWQFRCKITGKYIRTQPAYRYFATLRVRYW